MTYYLCGDCDWTMTYNGSIAEIDAAHPDHEED